MSNSSSIVDGTTTSDCQKENNNTNNNRHCHSNPEINLYNIFDRRNDNTNNDDDDDEATINDNDCSTNVVATSDEHGSYGIVYNNTMQQPLQQVVEEERVVQFQYQIQTSLPITAFQSDSSPLVVIEKAISDVLVRSLFTNPLCDKTAATTTTTIESRTGNLRRWRRASIVLGVRNNRQLQVSMNETTIWTGFQASPPDAILPGIAGVACHTELVDLANSCFTVGGAFTVMVTTATMESNTTSWIDVASKAAIRDAMDQQQLNTIHDEIYDISYVSDNPGTDVISPPLGQDIVSTPMAPSLTPFSASSSDIAKQRDINLRVWIFVPLSIVLFGIVLYEIYRYIQRYQQRTQQERILRQNQFYYENCLIDPPVVGAATTSGASPDTSTIRQSNVPQQQQSIVKTTEYGPFRKGTGSFPITTGTSMVNPYLIENCDNGVPLYVDTTRTNRWNDEMNDDENVPICNLDGLLDNNHNNDTSFDTELYYNSIASSSNYGGSSSNDTRGMSSTTHVGQFPSTDIQLS